MIIIKWFLIPVFLLSVVECARILVVTPYLGRSHAVFIHPIVLGLAQKGHNITMVTTNTIKDAPSNLHQIVLSKDLPLASIIRGKEQPFFQSTPSRFIMIYYVESIMLNIIKKIMADPLMQDFVKNDKSSFDIVIAEYFFQDAFYGFAHKYKAPLVLLGCETYWETVENIMGLPSTVSYIGREFSMAAGDLTLSDRIMNYLEHLWQKIITDYYFVPKHDAIIREHFGHDAPTAKELHKNISLVMFNTHYSFDPVRPLVPGVVEIAGVHLEQPEKLSTDIQQFLDEATDGFIYFSLGSRISTAAMSQNIVDAFIKSFSKLKQRVLWKWEDENKPTAPENIMMSKWFPQSAVLAHSNARIFITQGGILSIIEAVNVGIPIIGIPFYGDQFLNIAKMEYIGIGVKLQYSELSEETISKAINQIINNPKYADNAKEVSFRFRDRMHTPLETAVNSIEYVIRHRGATFMKSKLVDVPWYEYYLLDVYAVLLVIICLMMAITWKCACFLIGRIAKIVTIKVKKS